MQKTPDPLPTLFQVGRSLKRCVVLPCSAHGGHHLGIPATGKRVSFPVMTMARFQDGKKADGKMAAEPFEPEGENKS